MIDGVLRAQSGQPTEKAQTPSVGNGRESLIVLLLGATIISLMSLKAFQAYFFGENFIYLQLYQNNGSAFWKSFFSPITGIFYRPMVFALELPWHFILPDVPSAFHFRNFAIVLFELFLFHRIVCRIVESRSARIFGCTFFALSKIPLTLIGYINTIDSLVLSTLMLLAVLFFIRFAQQKRPWDYAAGIFFCLLSDFSKDYGLVINAVVVVIMLVYGFQWRNWKKEWQWWGIRIIPLVLSVGLYLWVRTIVLGGVTQAAANSDTGYAPRFSLLAACGKIARFGTTLCNTSWVDDGSNGAAGIPSKLATLLGSPAISSMVIGYSLICGVFLIFFIWKGGRKGMELIFPLVWCAAYLGPTLLVQSVNIYYHWEPLIAFAVLLSLLANAAGTRFTVAAGIPLLLLIGTSGFLSNREPRYHWSFITEKTVALQKALVEKYQGVPLVGVTFIARPDQIEFWRYAVADPMLQRLTHRPDLQVRYATYSDVGLKRVIYDDANLLLDTEHQFAEIKADAGVGTYGAEQSGPVILASVAPNSTKAGVPFNLQSNAISAFTIRCSNASPRSVILWNGKPLQTAFGNSTWLTALIPKELYQSPGIQEISVATDGQVSNKLSFTVLP